MPPRSDADLARLLRDPGFIPGARDLQPLLCKLVDDGVGEEDRVAVERALRRAGMPAAIAAARAIEGAEARARERFVALAGRIDGAVAEAETRASFEGALRDPAAGVRRRAAAALGRARDAETAGKTLAEALAIEADPLVRTAIAEALGKVGGDAAVAALAGALDLGGSRADEILRRARIAAARLGSRPGPGAPSTAPGPEAAAIRLDAAPPEGAHALRVALFCREGLQEVLLEEMALGVWGGGRRRRSEAPNVQPGPGIRPRVATIAPGARPVVAPFRGPLAPWLTARTWMRLGLWLPEVAARGGAEARHPVADLLLRPAIVATVEALTRGKARYRIAWGSGGKRRAETFRIAEEVAASASPWLNDPSGAAWQVEVYETSAGLSVVLFPAIADPRFAYRRTDVPAASHPTIAAAIARLGGARPDDVVWDPFVGSGLELAERHRMGPAARIVGTDIDPAALERAAENLDAAGAQGVELRTHDAFGPAPQGLHPSLVLTNPPLGRRLHRQRDLRPALLKFVQGCGDALTPGGRLVWNSPFPGETAQAAEAAGLRIARRLPIDAGGFTTEIQVFQKVKPPPRRR